MNCANHEQTSAIGVCATCGRALCPDCAIRREGRIRCKACLETPADTLRKSPTLAGVLSILPGLGQAYVGYYLAGFVNILVVGLLITVLNSLEHVESGPQPFLGLFLSFFWIFNVLDAVRRAKRYNRSLAGGEAEALPTDSPLVGGIILLGIGVLLTVSITFGVKLTFLQTIWPLGLVIGAGLLLAKYYRTRAALARRAREDQASNTSVTP
jgi:hypothetical protein